MTTYPTYQVMLWVNQLLVYTPHGFWSQVFDSPKPWPNLKGLNVVAGTGMFSLNFYSPKWRQKASDSFLFVVQFKSSHSRTHFTDWIRNHRPGRASWRSQKMLKPQTQSKSPHRPTAWHLDCIKVPKSELHGPHYNSIHSIGAGGKFVWSLDSMVLNELGWTSTSEVSMFRTVLRVWSRCWWWVGCGCRAGDWWPGGAEGDGRWQVSHSNPGHPSQHEVLFYSEICRPFSTYYLVTNHH